MQLQPTASTSGATEQNWRRAAGTIGALGIAAGAFGAHALEHHPRLDTWKTAALYHVFHAIALLVPNVPARARWLLVSGITIFCGSLYALVLLDEPRLGAITPIGGLFLIVGWLTLGWSKS